MRPWGKVPWVEGMTALHATAMLHGHYPPPYVSQPGASVYTEGSSSLQAGPEAYTSDAPQPRGLLCNPGSPP